MKTPSSSQRTGEPLPLPPHSGNSSSSSSSSCSCCCWQYVNVEASSSSGCSVGGGTAAAWQKSVKKEMGRRIRLRRRHCARPTCLSLVVVLATFFFFFVGTSMLRFSDAGCGLGRRSRFFYAEAASFLVGTTTTTTTTTTTKSRHSTSSAPSTTSSTAATGRLPSWLMSLRYLSSSPSSSSSSSSARRTANQVSITGPVAVVGGGGGGTTTASGRSLGRRRRQLSELHLIAPGGGGASSSLTVLSDPRRRRHGRKVDDSDGDGLLWTAASPSRSNRVRSKATQLFMGIRSLLGLGGGGKNKDPKRDDADADDVYGVEGIGDDDPTGGGDFPSSAAAALSSSSRTTLPPLRMGEDPVSKEVNVLNLDHRETTQEKINRVKAGFMTEAEKKAFLQTALTAGNTAESRRPLQSSNGNGGGGDSDTSKKRFFASPFPSDSILRNFARGTKGGGDGSGTTGSSTPGSELDSQKKKREYLDMVTNPDRFNRKPSTSTSTPSSGKTPIPDLKSMELKSGGGGDSTPPPAPSMPSDLGVRLGMAAMANESLRRQQEQDRKREIQWKMDVERRQHEQRALELTEWQQKMAGFEAQQRELRAKEEERRMKQDAEKRQAEKARLEQLMKAQEEYWAKKLEKEKSAKLKQLESQQQGGADGDDGSDDKDEEDTNQESTNASSKAAPSVGSDSTPVNEKALGPFNPDESNLLDMAKKDRQEDWEENQEIMEEVKARTLGVRPAVASIETEEDFLEEQARKKRDLDRKREEQMERLKALNSPLPSPAPGNRPPPPVFRPQVDYRPQRTAQGPAAPLFGRDSLPKASASSPSMADLPKNPPLATPSTKASPAPAPATKPQASMWGGFNFGSSKSAPPPPPKPRTPPSVPASAVKSSPPPSKAAPATPPAPSPPVAATKTGPIRMKLPLGDGDDDDDGVDVRANKRMSIADAMKRTASSTGSQSERSKKWGIDMSKFADD